MKQNVILIGILLLLVLYNNNSVAQSVSNKKTQKFIFKSNNSVGYSLGENGASSFLQSINGVTFSNNFIGVGGQISSYGFSSFPVFLSLERKVKQINFYGDIGINITKQPKEYPKESSSNSTALSYKFKNGLYGEVGIEYKKQLQNNTAFCIRLGYANKQFSYIEKNSWNNMWWWQQAGTINPATGRVTDKTYTFNYQTWQLSMGVEF